MAREFIKNKARMIHTTTNRDKVHMGVTNDNLVTIHTTQAHIKEGDILVIGKRSIPIVTVKESKSTYYVGENFFEINFKKDKK